jgi:uncharacterized membrane protein
LAWRREPPINRDPDRRPPVIIRRKSVARELHIRRRLLAAIVAGAAVLSTGLGLAPVALGASLAISTPYPAVSVEPGNTASFDLAVTSDPKRRVNLRVTGVPDGWSASIRGGGFVIDGVVAGPSSPPEVKLDVDVPGDASNGVSRIVVHATTGSDSADLALDLRVSSAAGGSVSLESEFPQLRGAATASFSFNLDLKNDTPRDLTFNLTTQGPEGWDVTATPSGQTQAASAPVNAGASSTIAVSAKPPQDVPAGTYPLHVTATSGSQTAEIDLQVEITGNYTIDVSTPNDVLSNRGTAGAEIRQEIDITNSGTAPLEGLTLNATAPTDWKVTFDPATPDAIAPGGSAKVTAIIVPSGNAITGDYQTKITVSNDQANDSVELRTTIETSQIWALVGIALIVLVLGGLFWVFRTYGRR